MRAGFVLNATLGALLAAAGAARADVVDDVQVGIMAHNVELLYAKNANKEDSPNLEAQVTFASPEALSFALSPHPFVVGSVNKGSDFDFAGAGLEWRWAFAESWRLDPSLAYVVHNGELENPFTPGTPASTQFAADNVLYGSRDLFRVSVGLTREFSADWSGQLLVTHLSHGQILGSGRNQGVDQVGVRLGWKFGE
jgi:lipid A 3-O-deacylase